MKKLLNVKEYNWLTALFTVMSVLMLTGCSLLSVQEKVNPIQANLLEKCPELSKHEGTTGKDVLYTLTNWATEYNECAARHNQLVDVVTDQGKK